MNPAASPSLSIWEQSKQLAAWLEVSRRKKSVKDRSRQEPLAYPHSFSLPSLSTEKGAKLLQKLQVSFLSYHKLNRKINLLELIKKEWQIIIQSSETCDRFLEFPEGSSLYYVQLYQHESAFNACYKAQKELSQARQDFLDRIRKIACYLDCQFVPSKTVLQQRFELWLVGRKVDSFQPFKLLLETSQIFDEVNKTKNYVLKAHIFPFFSDNLLRFALRQVADVAWQKESGIGSSSLSKIQRAAIQCIKDLACLQDELKASSIPKISKISPNQMALLVMRFASSYERMKSATIEFFLEEPPAERRTLSKL